MFETRFLPQKKPSEDGLFCFKMGEREFSQSKYTIVFEISKQGLATIFNINIFKPKKIRLFEIQTTFFIFKRERYMIVKDDK